MKNFDLKKDLRDWWSSKIDKQKKFHRFEIGYVIFSLLLLPVGFIAAMIEGSQINVSYFGPTVLGMLVGFAVGAVLMYVTLWLLGKSFGGLGHIAAFLHGSFFVALMNAPFALIIITMTFMSGTVGQLPFVLQWIAYPFMMLGNIVGFIALSPFTNLVSIEPTFDFVFYVIIHGFVNVLFYIILFAAINSLVKKIKEKFV